MAAKSTNVKSNQMPALTICTNQELERTALLRVLLNQVQFGCEFSETVDDQNPGDFEYEDWMNYVSSTIS